VLAILTMKTLLAILVLGASGCASYTLPPITAQKIVYDRKDPIGGTHIEAVGVRVDAGMVRADRATWVTTYPAWSISVTVEDYSRKVGAP
jgi:hypothetical protein